MIVLGADGKRKVYNEQNPNRDGDNKVMNAQFKSSAIISYVLREFYFRQLDLAYEDLYPEDLNAAVNSRIDGTPTCEHFASVYYSCLALTQSGCEDEIRYNLPAMCSNQYCIGCCRIEIDFFCSSGGLYCFGTGSGYACEDDGRNSGEGSGGNNCDANTPCPCGGGC